MRIVKFIVKLGLIAVFFLMGAHQTIKHLHRFSDVVPVHINQEIHFVPKSGLVSEKFKTKVDHLIVQIEKDFHNSSVMQNKLGISQKGVKVYADWHYSFAGNLTQQALILAQGILKAGKKLGSDFYKNPKIKAYMDTIQTKMMENLFSPLIHWTPSEKAALESTIQKHSHVFSSLLSNHLKETSSYSFSTTYFPSPFIPPTLISHNTQLIGSTSVALAIMLRKVIKKVSSKLMIKISERLLVKTVEKGMIKASAKRSTSLLGGSGPAVLATGACAPFIGPFALICGASAGVGAFVATEIAANEIDEYVTRDQFEAELNLYVNDTYEKFEKDLLHDIHKIQKKLTQSQAKIHTKKVRLIDQL